MKIVQISDLHFGAHNRHLATALRSRLHREQPDVIVATGDVANTPDADLFEQARQFFASLASCCPPNPHDAHAPQIIIVPGNHDRLARGWWFSRKRKFFEAAFPSRPSHYYFASEHVWIYGLDSTHPKALGTGRVTLDSLEQFYREHQRLKTLDPRFDEEVFKIVLVHHHPLPVNADRNWRERALMMVDAGPFLGAMMDCRIDLILHGHEHLQGVARFRSSLGGGGEQELVVISLGATLLTVDAPNRNWFNVVDIESTSRVASVTSYPSVPSFLDFEDTGSSYFILSKDLARQKRFETQVRDTGYLYREVASIADINADGDCFRVVEYEDLGVFRSGIERATEHKVDLPRTSGQIQLVRATAAAGGRFPGLAYVPGPLQDTSHTQRGSVHYNRPLPIGETLSYRVSWWALNSFALDTMQFDDKYTDASNVEFVHMPVCDPIRELTVVVKFPDGREPVERPQIRVTRLDPTEPNSRLWKRQVSIEQELESADALRYIESLRTAALRVSTPLKDHSYGIEWRVRGATREEDQAAVTIQDRVVQALKARLGRGSFLQVLEEISRLTRDELLPGWNRPTEHSLMVFDREAKQLVVAAALRLDQAGATELDQFLGLVFQYGVGIAGRVFKDNRCRLYQHKIVKGGTAPSYYQRIAGQEPEAVLLAFPLQSTTIPAHVYGVVCVGSRDEECPLALAGESGGPLEDDKLAEFQDILNSISQDLLEEAGRSLK